MKIYKDCEEFEAISSLMHRSMVNFMRQAGLQSIIVEQYYEGATKLKEVDKEIVDVMLKELGIGRTHGPLRMLP